MRRPTIDFLCDANVSTGFGHLSRCLQLADVLRPRWAVRFSGRFSPEARRRIAGRRFRVAALPPRRRGLLAVVDTMFDPENMDHYDTFRLERLRRRWCRVLVVSSALTAPRGLPADAVIGHMLRKPPRGGATGLRVSAGLEYAPVSAEFRRARQGRRRQRSRIRRIFLGFGGSRDVRGVKTVLDSLTLWGFDGDVDVLLSPFHRRFEGSLGQASRPYRLRIHSDVRSVASLLKNADVAFGTYGNITFEALCLGVPFVVVAAKDFQLAYARRLARRGLLRAIGRDAELETRTVVRVLNGLTPRARESLSRRGRKAVDGLGIRRIARTIETEARESMREDACRG